ncbi:hypothetical protein KI387_040708, partial [Taxus chinensis]
IDYSETFAPACQDGFCTPCTFYCCITGVARIPDGCEECLLTWRFTRGNIHGATSWICSGFFS